MIRVLIVEDEVLIAEAHRSYVERAEGFSVHAVAHTAKDAMRAVADAAAAGEPVDLVLLDIGLPDASGLDLAVTLGGVRPSPASSPSPPPAISTSCGPRWRAVWCCTCSSRSRSRRSARSSMHYRQFPRRPPRGWDGGESARHRSRPWPSCAPPMRAPAPRRCRPAHRGPDHCVRGDAGRALTAAEVAAVVGVSRVTAWRYLERFADDGVLTRETEYGRAGRPQVRYTWSASSVRSGSASPEEPGTGPGNDTVAAAARYRVAQRPRVGLGAGRRAGQAVRTLSRTE